MARKYKVPSYIRPCDKCGQGNGYHGKTADYRLCDTCFTQKADAQLQALIASAPSKELADTAQSMADSGRIVIMGVGF